METRKRYEKILRNYRHFVNVKKICKVLWCIVGISVLGILIELIQENMLNFSWWGGLAFVLCCLNLLIKDFYLIGQQEKLVQRVQNLLEQDHRCKVLDIQQYRQLRLLQELLKN